MKTDMSPKAISGRLNELNQLWKLCIMLSRARPVVQSKTGKELIGRKMESVPQFDDTPLIETAVDDNWMNTK